jgi:hypothetical protein
VLIHVLSKLLFQRSHITREVLKLAVEFLMSGILMLVVLSRVILVLTVSQPAHVGYPAHSQQQNSPYQTGPPAFNQQQNFRYQPVHTGHPSYFGVGIYGWLLLLSITMRRNWHCLTSQSRGLLHRNEPILVYLVLVDRSSRGITWSAQR